MRVCVCVVCVCVSGRWVICFPHEVCVCVLGGYRAVALQQVLRRSARGSLLMAHIPACPPERPRTIYAAACLTGERRVVLLTRPWQPVYSLPVPGLSSLRLISLSTCFPFCSWTGTPKPRSPPTAAGVGAPWPHAIRQCAQFRGFNRHQIAYVRGHGRVSANFPFDAPPPPSRAPAACPGRAVFA